MQGNKKLPIKERETIQLLVNMVIAMEQCTENILWSR